MTEFIYDNGGIVVLAETEPSQEDLGVLLEPIRAGRADAVFGLGKGHINPFDRVLTIGCAVLSRQRLASMSHVCYAFTRAAYSEMALTEKGSGITAEIASKLPEHRLKGTEVKLTIPRHFSNLLHALISLLIHTPLITYGAVGLLSTLIEWALFWLLDNLTSISVAVSTAIAFILSTIANWFMGRAWTFRHAAGSYSDILPVCLVSAVGLGLSELLMWLFISTMGMPNFLSKVVSTMLVFFWNYLARKKLVYRKK